MGRKRKKSGRRYRGPFTAKNFEDAMLRAGCRRIEGGNHPAYEHPTNGRKVPISPKWSSVKAGDPIFNSFVDFLECSKDELLDLLDAVR